MVIWLIGLSGAGKTSIGKALAQILKRSNPATVMLDGDAVRTIMGDDIGHSLQERELNGWRICRLCRYLDEQNIDVVCCILSLFETQRQWNRETYSRYHEVYIDVPMSVLEQRNTKGFYAKARQGEIKNVVGVDIPFTPPAHPDFRLNNAEHSEDFAQLAQTIINGLKLYN